MSQIKKIYIDSEELPSYDQIVIEEDKVFIPKNSLNLGDSVNIVYGDEDNDLQECTLLSIEHPNIYKNLILEAEIEFVNTKQNVLNNFELIVRAISRWDKTYTADEYYSFGLKDERFYFAKTSYHEEGENSFSYKDLHNLSKDRNEKKYFADINEEDRRQLFLDGYKLHKENKYKFKCEIKDNLVSFKIKNTSSIESFETDFGWITIFEGISIEQKDEDLSKRTIDLVNIVGVSEPNTVIDGAGLFGITFQKTHAKLYRFEVQSLDEDRNINLYNDEEYSRQVSTNFSNFYRNSQVLKLNSSDSTRDFENNFFEFEDVEGNEVTLSDSVVADDIKKIQINGLELKEGIHYTDRVVDIVSPMNEDHNGSLIRAFVDEKEKNSFLENEKYFPVEEITDGVSFEFGINPEVVEKIDLYPNGRLSDVLIEIDEDLVVDDFFEVGVQTNLNKFIDEKALEEMFSGKKFYMETFYKGKKRFFELGAIGPSRFTFSFDEEFTKGNESYLAIWKYNLANFIDSIISQYAVVQNTNSNLLPPDFSFSSETSIIGFDINQFKESLGFAMAFLDAADVEKLALKTFNDVSPYFDVNDSELDEDIKYLIKEKGIEQDYIRVILGTFQNVKIEMFKELLLRVILKDSTFEETLDEIISKYSGSSFQEYRDFRQQWMEDLDYNSFISTAGANSRRFFVSVDKSEVSIDQKNNTLVFVETPKANKNIVIRVMYDNSTLLERKYNTSDEVYDVESNIKELYKQSKTEKGIVELLEFYEKTNYNVIEQQGVNFVIVPKKLTENNDTLYADIEICSPFVRNNESVKRVVQAELTKVSDFLKNDFETSKTNRIFPYTNYFGVEGDGEWERESDYLRTDTEFISGNGYSYEFPKIYPIPTSTVEALSGYFDSDNLPVEENEFFSSLINNTVVPNDIIDKYLNVSEWFNIHDTKLGIFYKSVLGAIIDIKSNNRYYTEQKNVDNVLDDPFNLGNWFDGFYSGVKSPLTFSIGGEVFGKYDGSPWGTENSRKQMIDQIRNTIDGKFPEYELYFVDVTKFVDNRADTNYNYNYLDTSNYPISGSRQFIDNPYVNSKLKHYTLGGNVVDDNTNEVLIDSDDFSFITNNVTEYPEMNRDSYIDLNKIEFNVRNIVRKIENGLNMYWKFNTSILLKQDLPIGTSINAEYQYSFKDEVYPNNNLNYNIQKVNLGDIEFSGQRKFKNPNVVAYRNIENSVLHKVWLENYIHDDFNVVALEKTTRIIFNNTIEGFENNKDISVQYKVSNYFNLKKTNTFKDDFFKKRDIIWLNLTRDKKGYLKKNNVYQGFVEDGNKYPGENVFRLSDFLLTDPNNPDSITVKTSNNSKNFDLIKPIQYGQVNEDIIAMTSIRRNNNFEVIFDFIYDDDIERDLMQLDLFFRGNFVNVAGRQFFSENYSITIGIENSSVALIGRKTSDDGVPESQILANVRDLSSIIKRNVFYTVRMRLEKDNVYVFFNERYKEEKFYFSYNLKKGHGSSGVEAVAESLLGGLGVEYNDPNFYVDGDRIGIKTNSPKTNISNFRIIALEENNFKMGNTFEVGNFDDVISGLKKQFNIDGDFKKLKRTSSGYEYLQIGENLFAKENGGTYVKHSFFVDDFEVIGEYVYVKERLSETGLFVIINVYEQTLKLVDNIIVDGKQFVNEPIMSYLIDSSRIVSELKNINGKLFIITEQACFNAITWSRFPTDCVWGAVSGPWDIYGS